MTRRRRDALLGLAISLVALAGVLWQVDRSEAVGERGELPRLVCPLH